MGSSPVGFCSYKLITNNKKELERRLTKSEAGGDEKFIYFFTWSKDHSPARLS